ncbi:MAG: methyltransferase type 11 [Candidatus Ochrobactrum gambitense]|nr:MAG: methyltransferase type 11 [Candidatus Ochrobactrum gambitense]WEK17325.1 MAG: methyltransferase type 11 [Candidatus Ochrobactrum gambitense]
MLGYLRRGDFSGLWRRLTWYRREQIQGKLQRRFFGSNVNAWGILCTPHTRFIANAISERLLAHGIQCEISEGDTGVFEHEFYVVLCAQMFKKLPPPNKRVVFQLEQSVSSRWFSPEYISVLEESFAVIEYSMKNLNFLAEKGIRYPKVHYIPIGAMKGNETFNEEKEYDFLFYGDSISSERRKKFISELRKKYEVKVCSNLFGEELYSVIRRAKAVINIHYYRDALLEMPRISECISLGVPVLSEGTRDQGEYPELEGAVRFFEEDSVESMMSVAADMLRNIATINETLRQAILSSADRFNFMIDRFLTAIGAIPASRILETSLYTPKTSQFFALSLPETIERRRAISAVLPNGFELFDGIRNGLGWVGCGSSFSSIGRYALENNLEFMVVIEDDVKLPADFHSILREVLYYLSKREEGWDIFSGLMSELDGLPNIISAEEFGGRNYITIDSMSSTVFNIYNKSALQLLSCWDPTNTDPAMNTIDRYLARQKGLRVIVTLPFIVGHSEEEESTLWGVTNDKYTLQIERTKLKIELAFANWSDKSG